MDSTSSLSFVATCTNSRLSGVVTPCHTVQSQRNKAASQKRYPEAEETPSTCPVLDTIKGVSLINSQRTVRLRESSKKCEKKEQQGLLNRAEVSECVLVRLSRTRAVTLLHLNS